MGNGNISPKKVEPFTVSVPLRLDIGGTWDLKAFALPFEYMKPCTVNIALDLPTTLRFSSRDDDLIHIRDDYSIVTTRLDDVDFRSPFGLLLSICSHYQIAGFNLEIAYSIPPRSGLGGSGALAAGLIWAINHIRGSGIPLYEMAARVNDIEEGLRFSHCGLQDQCAALYGGVNKWTWQYSQPQKFTREPLLEPGQYHEISDRLVIAYLGRGHGADINQKQIDSLYDLHTRRHWFRINELTHKAAGAIRSPAWKDLRYCIEREAEIRATLVPERVTREAKLLCSLDNYDVSAGIAGAGAGGCIFALCEKPDVMSEVLYHWKSLLDDVPKSRIIANPKIAEHGICLTSS